MVNRSRHGKRITGGHSTLIQGLDKFLKELEEWPEVRTAHPRQFSVTRKSSRSGGFTFRATRWEVVGQKTVGIRCIATYGSSNQVVVLSSDDLTALKERLVKEGWCDGTW